MHTHSSERLSELVHRQIAPKSCAELLLDVLVRHGVTAVFGLPGGTIMPVYDALAEHPALAVVTCRHETAAVFAAMGHARATGRPAAVLVTSGPGLTNALTGLAAASCEGLPVLLVAGEVATTHTGRFSLQDGSASGLDVLAMTRPLTRFSARVEQASALEPLATRALATARGPLPGPAFLALPIDVARTRVRSLDLPVTSPPPPAVDREACEEVARRLARARRPTIVLGNGARGAGVAALVASIADRVGARVATTAHAKGAFPERHPRYLGVLGFGGHAEAVEELGQTDLALVLGSRLGDITTNGWTTRLGERLIQIDHDPAALGRNHAPELAVVGDVAASAAVILANLPASSAAEPFARRRLCLDGAPGRDDRGTPIKAAWLMGALERTLPRNTIFTVDIGEHAAFALHHLRVDEPSRFHMFAGLGSMGSGICAALGIKLASPRTPVVAVCGDGGLSMHAGELMTCAELGLAVVFVVLNDGRYRMVDAGMEYIFGRRSRGLPAHLVDLGKLAEACGALAVTVETPRDFEDAHLAALLRAERPVVLDVRIDASDFLSVQTRLASLKHFSEGAR